jgi:hypothetical protein
MKEEIFISGKRTVLSCMSLVEFVPACGIQWSRIPGREKTGRRELLPGRLHLPEVISSVWPEVGRSPLRRKKAQN